MTSVIEQTGAQQLEAYTKKLAPVFDGAIPEDMGDGVEIYTAEHNARFYLKITSNTEWALPWAFPWVPRGFQFEFQRDAAISDFKKSLARMRKEKSKRRLS